ncbi:alpha/beta hydrolase [uncultured Jatrophihabitans sp.]|uniref:alpha/beta hydrolase n=1 Tax=uncultured Jatrophihabitans sp. TaxID=1610747 RepID=UPI0035CC7BD9
MRLARVLVSATVLLLAATGASPACATPLAHAPSTLRVGALTLSRCNLGTSRTTYCGSLRVPLDPADGKAGTIKIGLGWLPSSGTARGTVLAQEGGPGYPSTGTAADFETMFGPTLAHRNLLLVDARGTGRSTPIDCEPLQSLPSPTPRFTAAADACGRQLNHTFRRTGGGWVHASDLFSTANTARDTARVLAALKLAKVDLYGDSYGTYFAQSFLARYPRLVRSVVLDSAYEARGLDPWYRTTVSTARRAFDTVCRRAVGCPGGWSWARISELAAVLRRHAATGTVVGTDAVRHRVTVGVTALLNIVNDAGYDTDPYRQLDAAARAYLERRDATPLLRLYAQDVGYDYSDYSAKADYYSDGLYLAVACTDYPQLFDMRSSPSMRRTQLAASIKALPARTFAPFTTREWLTVLPYTETYTGCLGWPAPTHPADPPIPAGAALNPRHIPVLILNGQLDSLTPAAGGAHIKRQMGRGARTIVAANTVHLVALENDNVCGRTLVQRFVAHPTGRLDASCAARIPRIRAVSQFPRRFGEVVPAHGHASPNTRRLAAIAVAAAGDALIRFDYVDGARDLGLRGGSVHYDEDGNATLHAVRWTTNTMVSGTVTVTATGGRGHLQVTGPRGRVVHVLVRWGSGLLATATIGRTRLTAPAP